MARDFSEAHKRASELIHLPLAREALIPALAYEFKNFLDEQLRCQERTLQAEAAATSALTYANACEKAAWEWKKKLDKAEHQLAEERDWFEVAKQAAAAVRQKTLEEAAQLCDRQGHVWGLLRSLEATYRARAAAELSDKLRALIAPAKATQEAS